MSASILPFSLAKSNEKLTDRGAVAMVDEFAEAIGLPEKVDREFPVPGSNRGIDPSAYVRTLIYHFSEGGRHIEEVRQIKADEGFRSLIDLEQMPGPDAVGDWLRRMGEQGQQEALRQCNDMLVQRYLNELEKGDGEEESEGDGLDLEGANVEGANVEGTNVEGTNAGALTLDVDATIIELGDASGSRRIQDGPRGQRDGSYDERFGHSVPAGSLARADRGAEPLRDGV